MVDFQVRISWHIYLFNFLHPPYLLVQIFLEVTGWRPDCWSWRHPCPAESELLFIRPQTSTSWESWRRRRSWCSRRPAASQANASSATTTASSSSTPSSLTAWSCPTTCTGTCRGGGPSGGASSRRGCSCSPSSTTSQFSISPDASPPWSRAEDT